MNIVWGHSCQIKDCKHVCKCIPILMRIMVTICVKHGDSLLETIKMMPDRATQAW